MTDFASILTVVLPVYLTMGAGAAARHAGILPKEADAGLMKLAVTLLTPCLILGRVVGNASVMQPLPGFRLTWIDTGAQRFPDLPAGVVQRVAADPAGLVGDAPPDAAHLIVTFSHALDLALCHGLFQRAHFTFEGGQSGLCGGKVRLRGVAGHRGRFARSIGIGHRLLGGLRIGISFGAGKLSCIQRGPKRGIVTQRCQLLFNLRRVALGAFQSLRGGGHGGVCDARFGLFACLCRQRLGERDFGISTGGFGRGQPFNQLRAACFC